MASRNLPSSPAQWTALWPACCGAVPAARPWCVARNVVEARFASGVHRLQTAAGAIIPAATFWGARGESLCNDSRSASDGEAFSVYLNAYVAKKAELTKAAKCEEGDLKRKLSACGGAIFRFMAALEQQSLPEDLIMQRLAELQTERKGL